jgi:hypothetical protein
LREFTCARFAAASGKCPVLDRFFDMDARDLAARLLDAQVDYVLSELTGERFEEMVERDVDDLLDLAAQLTVADVVEPDAVKEAGRLLLDRVGDSPLVEDMTGALSDAMYDLAASDEFRLGDVVAREPVSALVAKLLSMRQLQDRALDRMTESPLVAIVASKFVTKIVSDFLQQNRARAEKLPGMSSLLSLGTSAANKVRSPFDRHLDQLLGDAAGKSAQYALRRTNNAIRELIHEAPLQDAALELWDLHADEPIGELREYLSRQDLRELVLIVRRLLVQARTSDYAGHVLDAGVDVFFERYSGRDVATVLDELGLDRDVLCDLALRFAGPALEAAAADGTLADLVRARLEPFFASEAVLNLLDAY